MQTLSSVVGVLEFLLSLFLVLADFVDVSLDYFISCSDNPEVTR